VLREVMQLRENLKLVQLENLAPQPLLEDYKPADVAVPTVNTVTNTLAAVTPGAINHMSEVVTARAAHDLAAEERARALAAQAEAAAKASEVGLYRHGVRLVFEGDYLTTMAFLESLEQKSWRFFWQSLQYDVEQYPKARVTLTLYTLSPERAWLGV
jgi:MSHA biogenesis protein MshJ